MGKNNSSDFINFGTYIAEEVDILKSEFKKVGIPVKVLYPGTNIGKESTAEAKWTAYTLLIPTKDCETAFKICERLNIKARYKIPVPRFLYTKVNRYIFGALLFLFLVIILGSLGIIKNTSFFAITISILSFSYILFLAITSYKIIKNSFKKDN